MNYRVFYPSQSPDDFQADNAYTVELVKAIEDAVKDGADVISNSWGASYQNTFAWPDPMVQAAEAAVDAGVTMVYAQGNAGPDGATGNAPANSTKVIAVGAVTKTQAIFPGSITITGPAAVPADLVARAVPGRGVRAADARLRSAPRSTCRRRRSARPRRNKTLGVLTARRCQPVARRLADGQDRADRARHLQLQREGLQRAAGGAIAAIIYNNAANGEAIATMGAGVHAADVTIQSWHHAAQRRSRRAELRDRESDGAGEVRLSQSLAAPIQGDVMAGFSSRGPTRRSGSSPTSSPPASTWSRPGTASATSRSRSPASARPPAPAWPRRTSRARPRCCSQLHPNWTPAQVKSALMTTATEDVCDAELQARQQACSIAAPAAST